MTTWEVVEQYLGDLERYIHQTAHYLRRLGVRKGSRVAILSRNCPEWIIAEFALYQLGAIVVKINWRLTPAEQARMLARNRVDLAVKSFVAHIFSTSMRSAIRRWSSAPSRPRQWMG